jgi:hypothetical protein
VQDIDDFLHRQEHIIESVGWAVIHVLPTDEDPGPPFAYTVGLTAHDHPELLIAGLPSQIAHSLLNDIAGRVYDTAQRFSDGQHIKDLIVNYDAVIVAGAPTEDLLPGVAMPATAATASTCSRWSGLTATAGSRGTPDMTCARSPSR